MPANVDIVQLCLWATLVGVSQCLISCDFEDSLCDWSDLSNSTYHWTRHPGPTADFTSGPHNDHTFKDAAGHFLYTNGDRASRSAVARLRSNTITLTSNVNFTFWYNMNGNGIGNVSLIRENNDTSAGIVLWVRHGRQGFNWLESHISLNPGTFQLQFESTVSRPYGSDIALDDIKLLSETQVVRTRPPSTSTIETTQTSEGMSTTTGSKCNVHDPGLIMSGSCNFETNGTCGYTSSGGPLHWGLAQGKRGYINVIPGDHGTGTGHYMYLGTDKTGSSPGYTASLVSPALGKNTLACLQFAYIITSGLPITLNVYAETSGQRRLLASITTHTMTSWTLRENITLCADTSTKIVFEAANKSHSASVGLDDVNVTSGDCNDSYRHTAGHQSTMVTTLPLPTRTSRSSKSAGYRTFTPTKDQPAVTPSTSATLATTSKNGQIVVTPSTPATTSTNGQTAVSQSSWVTTATTSTKGQTSVMLTTLARPFSTSSQTENNPSMKNSLSPSAAPSSQSLETTGTTSGSDYLASPSTTGGSVTTGGTAATTISNIHTTSFQDNITTSSDATSTIIEPSTISSNSKGPSVQTSPSVTASTHLPRSTTPSSGRHEQSSQGGLSYDDKVVLIVVACGALLIAGVVITVWRLRVRRKLNVPDIPSTLDTSIELQANIYKHSTHM
ncbi:mucin-21-like [Haliotis cracherodii]|uniref:mucin-21-like n=1 Tax=Haliotis cracherodii TaxID=6455 RepID=UPI0039E812F2